VLSSTTTGSVEAFCWVAATAASCPGLTQLACAALDAINDGTKARDKAIKILIGVLIFAPC
jgi:hypothetical protein